jgi:hypothetical protein
MLMQGFIALIATETFKPKSQGASVKILTF